MVTTSALHVERYEPQQREEWDEFVRGSKNGTFLFNRGYMDYHAERFADASFVVRNSGGVVALLPGHAHGDTYVSHGGLTYGGLVYGIEMRTALMLTIFEAVVTALRGEEFRHLLYKPVPHIYHREPAEEDLYALFRNGAVLRRRDVSSTIDYRHRSRMSERRRRGAVRARRHGIDVARSDDFESFMSILGGLLEAKYRVTPVHTADELRMLAERFPQNIELVAAFRGEEMLGGVVMYIEDTVAHAQYIAATDEGKRLGALDAVFEQLIVHSFCDRRYFDFGISTVNQGRDLNEALIENKEGFGARAVVYDAYELDLA